MPSHHGTNKSSAGPPELKTGRAELGGASPLRDTHFVLY